MDGPKWPASNIFSTLGCSPPGGHEGHPRPVPHHMLSDNEGRPRPPPVDASKLSKTYAFRALSTCAKELASKFKPPAGLGSKHGLVYSLSKHSKTHYFRALFPCTYKSDSEMDGPKWPASNIFSSLGRSPPARNDGHRGPILHYILGGGDHPRHSPHVARRGEAPSAVDEGHLGLGRGTASTWEEGAPVAWDTLLLGHRRGRIPGPPFPASRKSKTLFSFTPRQKY